MPPRRDHRPWSGLVAAIVVFAQFLMYLPGSTQSEIYKLLEETRRANGRHPAATFQTMAGFLGAAVLLMNVITYHYKQGIRVRTTQAQKKRAEKLVRQKISDLAANRNYFQRAYVHAFVKGIIGSVIAAELEDHLKNLVHALRTFQEKIRKQERIINSKNARIAELQRASSKYENDLEKLRLNARVMNELGRLKYDAMKFDMDTMHTQYQAKLANIVMQLEEEYKKRISNLESSALRLHGQTVRQHVEIETLKKNLETVSKHRAELNKIIEQNKL